MTECLFCKIASGETNSVTVFENDSVKAFLDISQVTPGHTLVIPKKHIENIFDYTEEDAAEVFRYVPMIARAIKKSDPVIQGLNIVQNNGKVASQTVMHSHFHLIPRYSDQDGINMNWQDNSKEYSSNDLQNIADNIAKNLEN